MYAVSNDCFSSKIHVALDSFNTQKNETEEMHICGKIWTSSLNQNTHWPLFSKEE